MDQLANRLESSPGEHVRQPWADLCRVVAIYGAILIHACGPIFYQFGKIPEGDWLSSNLMDSFVRCSVPLFVMLSGALLLPTTKSPSTPFDIAKRISKVLIPLIVWNTGYLIYLSRYTGKPIDWLSMLIQVPMYHLWFVYMIIGVYFLLPVLEAVFRVISCRVDLQIYLLTIWLVVTCLPIYQTIPVLSLFQQTTLLGYGGYFLIGGVLASKTTHRVPTFLWVVAYVASVGLTFILTWSASAKVNAPVETAYLYFSANVVVASIASFVVLSRAKIKGNLALALHWLSDRSFLIFFMHVLILERVNIYVGNLHLPIPAFISILAISLITFCICLVIASLLRLIPKSRIFLG